MAIKGKGKNSNSSLSKRAGISYSSRDQGGGGSRIINWKEVSGEVNFFQPSIGKNEINIIPFEIKSKNHPLVKHGQMEIGEFDYCLDIWTHRNVGPSESSVICLKKTYGKACPICEESEKLKKQGKEKESASLIAKRRVIYNVEDIRKKPGVLQVFEVSHFLFEKELIDEAKSESEGDDSFINFASPEAGSTIKFRCSKSSQGGYEFNEFKSFSFGEREEPIDDDLLSGAISFDEHLNILNYEKVQAILFGADEDSDGDGEEESEEEKPRKKKLAQKDDDDEEEDREDEKPAKKAPASKSKKASDDDDEDDEEAEKSVKKSTGKNKCPHGHTFGEDADEHPECDDCEIWSKCTNRNGKG